MDKQKLEEVKKSLSPFFDEYFASEDFDESLLEFWINYFEANKTNESTSQKTSSDLRSNLANVAALSYVLHQEGN